MPGFGSRCLLCAIVMMLACTSAAKARSWRYYGYHWYGHTWSNPNRGNDERRGDESAPRAEDKSDLSYRVGDFGSAIERMIRACDQQVVELKKMPLGAVTQIVKPAEDQHQALEQNSKCGAEQCRNSCYHLSKKGSGRPYREACDIEPYTRGNGGFARGIAPDVHDLLRPA